MAIFLKWIVIFKAKRLIKSQYILMMKSEQDETALLSATENQKLIVSKALCIVMSAVYILGIGSGLAVYHFCLV